MKRVRYLAGAVGLAPMALGAVAGTGAHAADVTGQTKTVAAYPLRVHQHPAPDIQSIACSAWGGDWLKVLYNHTANNPGSLRCFEDGGATGVYLPHFSWIYTGNNLAFFSIYYDGRSYGCFDSHKNTRKYAQACGVPDGAGTLQYINIY